MALTEKECQLTLENRFNTKDVKLIDFKLTKISEHKEGFMGEHNNLLLEYELNEKKGSEELFIKSKPVNNQSQQEVLDNIQIYEKEIFLYDTILKQFEKRGYDVSFAPRSFYCIPSQAIIMENKVSQGYKLSERNIVFDMNKMQCVLKALALYHSAGFANENSISKEQEKPFKYTDTYSEVLAEGFFDQYIDFNEMSVRIWKSVDNTILSLIDLLPKDNKFIDEFKSLYTNCKMGKVFVQEMDLPKTVGHGDLWSNNILFKFDGDKPVCCCLVDFQVFRYFYPAFDVALAIYANTDADFRAKHLKDLLTYYYENFCQSLEKYGFSAEDVMTYDQLEKSFSLVRVEALTQVTFTNGLIYLPKDVLTNTMTEETGYNELLYNTAEKAVMSFRTNEVARKVFIENLEDMYNALIERKTIFNI